MSERVNEYNIISENGFTGKAKSNLGRKPFFERKVTELLALAGIQVNGSKPYDIQVHNPQFYRRFLTEGRMGLGESYQDGWWDCEQIDEMLYKMYTAQKLIVKHVQTPLTLFNVALNKFIPHGSTLRSKEIGQFHYDVGNELYKRMLDPNMIYTCAYWDNGAKTLEQAQIDKMDRICQKLKLEPGMTLLDIGCGWGGLAKYAAENYGVKVTGISVSEEQLKYARENSKNLPIEFRYQDYRDVTEKFDRIVSVGMFEAVGKSYYGTFLKKVSSLLKDDGLFVLHTLGFSTSDYKNPWLTKYIFPGGHIPSLKHFSKAYEGHYVLEHMENISYNYAKTLRCWADNLEKNWKEIHLTNPKKYDQRFYRTWRYYLISTIPGFWARKAQVWQFVLSKNGVKGGYKFEEAQ